MMSSILVKMPEITREFDEEIGVEVINKYFVRLKSDVYVPLFNLPLLYPEVFSKEYDYTPLKTFYDEDDYTIASILANVMYEYYKKYLKLRKCKRFKVRVFLPEKYGGYALYYLLQKFMIGEATPKEIKIIREFLLSEIFDGKRVNMYKLLEQYYTSIWRYNTYKNSIFVNTPVGNIPLYVSKTFLDMCIEILKTFSNDYYNIAFVNVLTSQFFGKSLQIGSTRFNLLKSIGELDLNWKNVNVISFEELCDINDVIIGNNLEMTHPEASYRVDDDCCHTDLFLSHSPILSAVGNAIDFKNKSVMFLFAILKKNFENDLLIRLGYFNHLSYLNNKNIEYFVTSVPFKNIRKFIYRDEDYSGIFIIEQSNKVIPLLSTDVGLHWVGVGRDNTIIRYTDYGKWYGLLRKLASPEHLKMAEEKTQEWLKNKDFV